MCRVSVIHYNELKGAEIADMGPVGVIVGVDFFSQIFLFFQVLRSALPIGIQEQSQPSLRLTASPFV